MAYGSDGRGNAPAVYERRTYTAASEHVPVCKCRWTLKSCVLEQVLEPTHPLTYLPRHRIHRAAIFPKRANQTARTLTAEQG